MVMACLPPLMRIRSLLVPIINWPLPEIVTPSLEFFAATKRPLSVMRLPPFAKVRAPIPLLLAEPSELVRSVLAVMGAAKVTLVAAVRLSE